MDHESDTAGDEAFDETAFAPRSRTLVEGGDALDLYVRQIAHNLTTLEKQVGLLRDACQEHAKLLRETE